VSSWLAESVLQFAGKNYVTGRAEIVDKDELFACVGVVRIKALTLGYSRDVLETHAIVGALGANVTLYSIPDAITPDYGNSPRSYYIFIRLRGHGGHSMQM